MFAVIARQEEVNRAVRQSLKAPVSSPGSYCGLFNICAPIETRSSGSCIQRFDKGRSSFINALNNAQADDWQSAFPPTSNPFPPTNAALGTLTSPNILTPCRRHTRLKSSGGAAQLSPPPASPSLSPPEDPTLDEMDHVWQSVDQGTSHSLEEMGEFLMTGGAGGTPSQFGRNDAHGSPSPVGSACHGSGTGDPLAATVGSPRSCAIDFFDPIGLRAGAPETLRRRNTAVPTRGNRSPSARSPSLTLNELTALNFDSPLGGKGKGKGLRRF
jgi:hypothetical protein